MNKMKPYVANGVQISKADLSVGDKVEVIYSGLLVEDGADAVYLHAGFGDDWKSSILVPMEHENNVFKTTLKVTNPGSLNITFKDSANNWDNNSNSNYTFKVNAKTTTNTTKAAGESKIKKAVSTKTSTGKSEATSSKTRTVSVEAKAEQAKKSSTKSSVKSTKTLTSASSKTKSRKTGK